MRPFDQALDLDLDFSRFDRPNLITAVLAQCAGRHDPDYWWAQPVGDRTGALLQVAALTDQRDHVSLSASCAVCREVFEFDLSWRDLPGSLAAAGRVRVPLDGGRSVTVRRPTGDDLRRWREGGQVSRTAAVRTMLESLVVAGEVALADEALVSAALAAADPLVDFTVSCACPACDAPNEVVVDLERLALSRLAAQQTQLLHDVHRLASRYGWTESDVLAMPPARRTRYLSFIDNEER
jgi:hypothetical protein